MALYDWNHDGKKDFTDDFIEYQMYRASINCDDIQSKSPSGAGAVVLMILIIIAFPPVGILLLISLLLGD